MLSGNYGLVGKRINIYFLPRNITTLDAFLAEDGTELGVLYAARPWDKLPHSLRQRKEILRLTRLGKLKNKDDPLEAYIKYKREHASTGRRAATAYAKATRHTGSNPDETSSSVPDSQIPFASQRAPSPAAAEDAAPRVKKLAVRKILHL
ncbi:hypothetical protein FQZ97_1079500 [compost metagenome]